MNKLLTCFILSALWSVNSFGSATDILKSIKEGHSPVKPKEVSCMQWLRELGTARDSLTHELVQQSTSSTAIQGNNSSINDDALRKIDEALDALMLGQHKIDQKPATQEERKTIISDRCRSRLLYPDKPTILVHFIGLDSTKQQQKADNAGVSLDVYKRHIVTLALVDGTAALLSRNLPHTSQDVITCLLIEGSNWYRDSLNLLLNTLAKGEQDRIIQETVEQWGQSVRLRPPINLTSKM